MAISKVVLHDDSGADRTLVDLTGDTVAPETLVEGATAHDKAGNPITGTAKPGSDAGGVGQKGIGENAETFNATAPEKAVGKNSHIEGGQSYLKEYPGVVVSNVVPAEQTYEISVDINKDVFPHVMQFWQNGVLKYEFVTRSYTNKDENWQPSAFVVTSYSDISALTPGTYDIKLLSGFAMGDRSHVEGNNNIANAREAHVEGWNNMATAWTDGNGKKIGDGVAAHVEGRECRAVGRASHAEGRLTKALSAHSHAEGNDTTASGEGSHAEGFYTIASGEGSHAEGFATEASGYASHAEGEDAIASDYASHAEGGAIASGWRSHAEGSAEASGDDSHAEGGAIASGYASHAEGSAEASGDDSHAEGRGAIASGEGSHAEGSAEASGDDSHAEGGAIASGWLSHAEGDGTTASGDKSHAEGRKTEASGQDSHAEGEDTIARERRSHAEGYATTAAGTGSHAEGRGTLAETDYSHVQGKFNTDYIGKYAHIVGNGDPLQRSNAHTLDWDGNSWYQGNVLVGGKSMDIPDAELTPTSVVIKSSTPGSIKRFKITVDDTGVIKATEAV